MFGCKDGGGGPQEHEERHNRGGGHGGHGAPDAKDDSPAPTGKAGGHTFPQVRGNGLLSVL